MSNPFAQATKRKSFLRMALSGISGSGKTYSALNIARYLVPDGKIAVIDTEHGSASKYADVFKFDVVELPDYSPNAYIAMIQAAAANGYDVLIVDSLSHAWVGEGGVLDLVNKATLASKSKNAYTEGWSKGTPAQNALVEALLAVPCHLIATMRAKSDYIMETDRNGKSAPRKIGLAPIQREGMEYEFDVVAEMNLDHALIIEKTRCQKLDGKVIIKPGAEIAETLRVWLTDGAEPVKVKTPAPIVDPVPAPVPDEPPAPKPSDLDEFIPRAAPEEYAQNGESIDEELMRTGEDDTDYHPARDPHIFSQDTNEDLKTWMVEQYPPIGGNRAHAGSTILLAAFEAKIITKKDWRELYTARKMVCEVWKAVETYYANKTGVPETAAQV